MQIVKKVDRAMWTSQVTRLGPLGLLSCSLIVWKAKNKAADVRAYKRRIADAAVRVDGSEWKH
jgi:hypothetical protein